MTKFAKEVAFIKGTPIIKIQTLKRKHFDQLDQPPNDDLMKDISVIGLTTSDHVIFTAKSKMFKLPMIRFVDYYHRAELDKTKSPHEEHTKLIAKYRSRMQQIFLD